MASTLKERKEQFVTGLIGGSTIEIYKVTSVSVISYLVYLFFYNRLKHDRENSSIIKVLDFLLNWMILLLSITSYASKNGQLVAFVSIPVVLTILFELFLASNIRKNSTKSKAKKPLQLTLEASNLVVHKSFLTVYRSQMMIITMLAILAVDFNIFPRRFAKVETWGTSLMDLGVGSFVFSLGLFSSKSVILNKFNGKAFKFRNMVLKSIKDSIPLLILGLIRLISVKMIGYQEHVSEYGYHWNFFFTLGFLPIFVNLLSPLTSFIPQIFLSIAIAVIYEVLLMRTELLKFILVAPRVDLISQNREGIFSFIGYLSIFLAGESSGFFLLPSIKGPKNLFRPSSKLELVKMIENPTKSWTSVTPLKGSIIFSIVFQVAYYVIDTCYSYHVSRRLANLLYVLWVCAYNTTFLALFYLASYLYDGETPVQYVNEDAKENDTQVKSQIKQNYLDVTPLTLEAVNRNGLLLFLVSNLLTGLVNMTFNTLDMSSLNSLLILISYAIVLLVILLTLYKNQIFIKI